MSGRKVSPSISRREALVIGAGAAATLVVGRASAADDALIAAAEKEGELMVYGDLNSTPLLVDAFSKKYKKIKVTSYSAAGWQTYNRYLAEEAAGRAITDAFYTGEDTMLQASIDGKLLPYTPEATKGGAFPDYAMPKDTHYVLGNAAICMLAWNKDAMGNKPTPTDWTDFANPPPEWNNLIGWADSITSSAYFAVFAAFYQNYGVGKGADIFKGIMKTSPDLSTNIGVQVSKLETGERPLALFLNTSHIARLLGKGVPVAFVRPKSGAIGQYNAAAIMKTTKHPNAAKLFIEYALGDEGQAVQASHNLLAIRNGVAPPKGIPPAAEIKLMPLDLRQAMADKDTINNWWQQATGYQIK